MKFKKIILSVPHSSIENYYDGWSGGITLFDDVKQLTDWHTDFIFSSANKNVIMHRFPYSRFYIDVERLENDALEKNGTGIIYSKINGHVRSVSDDKKEELLNARKKYLDNIAKELTEDTILIDCHSFSSNISPDVDVCIGFNDDESCPDDETIDAVTECFTRRGYSVSLNQPYSNSLTPKTPINYKSIMLEINKSTYMDEDTLLLNRDIYKKIMRCIDDAYKVLLKDE